MKSPFCSFLMVAACVALASSGCSADGASSPAAAQCKAEAAQELVGKEKPTDAEAMQLTGAKTVRQIQTGDMVTHDFRDDRVTIETDPATGLITRATCG